MRKGRIGLVAGGAVVVATCAALGMWQLARLSDRKAENARLLSRAAEPVAQLSELPALHGGRSDPSAYRRVRITGRYDVAHEVVLRARSLDGRAGNHVLTPLRTDGGVAVVVDRGWVPFDLDRPPIVQAAPPSEPVVVTGILEPSEPKPRVFGPSDPATGALTSIGRLDLERLARQIPYPIAPLALALESQQPPQADLPKPAGLPAPGEGPHLSYAVQWFIFGLIALITTVLLIRREPRAEAVADRAEARVVRQ